MVLHTHLYFIGANNVYFSTKISVLSYTEPKNALLVYVSMFFFVVFMYFQRYSNAKTTGLISFKCLQAFCILVLNRTKIDPHFGRPLFFQTCLVSIRQKPHLTPPEAKFQNLGSKCSLPMTSLKQEQCESAQGFWLASVFKGSACS